jgi:hypothetical protein
MACTDPQLASELAGRLVDRFLRVGGLSPGRRDEALGELTIEHGLTPRGVHIIRVVLPIGCGHPEYEWDGTAEGARSIVDSMADVANDDVAADRSMWGPTGWEPEYDADS